MSENLFHVNEHTVPCQHLREYRYGQKQESDVLQMYVREYRPRENDGAELDPQAVTIIFCHGNGESGGCFEPFFDDLLKHCGRQGVRIRRIWAADMSNKGRSAILNEHKLGDDPSLLDWARDLLGMVNAFRENMVRPIIGIGHSVGAVALVNLSLMHPRLFHSLVMLDPTRALPPREAAANSKDSVNFARSTARRRNLWPSREAAVQWFAQNPFYKLFERRMLDAYLRHILRDAPTASVPDAPPGSVTLVQSRDQEAWSLVRPNWTPFDPTVPLSLSDRLLRPDVSVEDNEYETSRPEYSNVVSQLPFLRPGVLFVFGSTSEVSSPAARDHQMAITGTGLGGSGGVKAGRVKRVDIQGTGHIVPFQKPDACAEVAADYLRDEARRFREETDFLENNRIERSKDDMLHMSDRYLEFIKDFHRKRPLNGSSAPQGKL